MLVNKLKAKFAVTFGFVWVTLGWFTGAKAATGDTSLNIARQSGVSSQQVGAAKQLTANFYAAKAVVSVYRHPSEESEMVTQTLHG